MSCGKGTCHSNPEQAGFPPFKHHLEFKRWCVLTSFSLIFLSSFLRLGTKQGKFFSSPDLPLTSKHSRKQGFSTTHRNIWKKLVISNCIPSFYMGSPRIPLKISTLSTTLQSRMHGTRNRNASLRNKKPMIKQHSYLGRALVTIRMPFQCTCSIPEDGTLDGSQIIE